MNTIIIVNKKFGEQFQINDAKVVEPTTLPAIEKYLATFSIILLTVIFLR